MVEVKNLVKIFGETLAVDHLNMEVKEGEIFGMLGLNGAGKSTTMRCMLSLIKPDAGTISFFGKNIKTHREFILRNIGCLIERPDHYNYLSAQNNVKLTSRLYGHNPSTKEIEAIFELVGLKGKETHLVKTFSQGMKQRLGIANTLIHNPKLILLDEPTNGLDPQGIIDLRNLILRLKSEFKKTIILSSHILSEIEMIADSLVIIHKGKNMIQGKMSELLSEKEIAVDIETDDSEKLITQMKEKDVVISIQKIDTRNISVKINKTDLNLLHQLTTKSGEPIYHFNTRNKLEDYFLKLTQTHD